MKETRAVRDGGSEQKDSIGQGSASGHSLEGDDRKRRLLECIEESASVLAHREPLSDWGVLGGHTVASTVTVYQHLPVDQPFGPH